MRKQAIIIICCILLMNVSAFAQYRIPDTGQTKCYDNEKEIPCPKPGEPFYGQDGNYSINPMSFTKLDEWGRGLPGSAKTWAMVRDNNTGLIWEVKTDDGSVHDKDNTYTWEQAKSVLEKLNAKRFGGFSDWRIPACEELRSIAYYEKCPAADQTFFPKTQSDKLYLTADTYACSPDSVWGVLFFNGCGSYTGKSSSFYVRAVRGGQPRSFDHLVIDRNGTVTDKRTGLMWQQGEPGEMTWEQALKYCENLDFAGYGDWRLPTIKELASLPQLDRCKPVLDKKYFPNVHSDSYYWTSTTNVLLYRFNSLHGSSLVVVNFGYGFIESFKPSYSMYVRAVRGGQSDHLVVAQKRLAILIGNAAYVSGKKLANPLNDIKDVATILNRLSFDVISHENLKQKQMKIAIDQFGNKLKQDQYQVGLFYYAGHGMQVKGVNYLIPVDADPQTENAVEYDCINAGRILTNMEGSGCKVNIVILDACRHNPFERSWQRGPKDAGFAWMDAPAGTLIAYSTSPNKTASDGSDRNSFYTAALLQHIQTPNITILEMFQNARKTVIENTNNNQVPWESTKLTENFYFSYK